MPTPRALAALLCSIALPALAQVPSVDAGIPAYVKGSEVSGNLNSIGSDTLNNLMTLWAEGFRAKQAGVKIQVEGKGSSTAPPALIEGTAQLGPMSREMKAEELEAFEKKFGYKPTRLSVAVDALAVYVNKDNAVEKLTLTQVDAIFGKTLACGAPRAIALWGDAGAAGTFATLPISLYGRNSASGTYGYFKEHALCKGDFKDTVKEQPGSASVVQGIAADRAGIGYSGIGYKTSGVRTVPLAKAEGGEYVGTETADVLSGRYPLARFLYVYVNKAPGKPADPLVREFARFVLSSEGQGVVVKDGYIPVPLDVHRAELAKLD